jgi:hypothetical protein
VGALRCSCEQKHQIWGEFWWLEGKHELAFFDDRDESGTYTEQLMHRPACGRRLERKKLQTATHRAKPEVRELKAGSATPW